jgi:hypothetical protein
MPDYEDISDAGNCIPTPLLTSIVAIGSKKSRQDHDEICEEEHDDVASIDASQQSEVEEQQWGCQAPVHITSPEYLTSNVEVGIWNPMLVVLGLAGVVGADAGAICHSEVGNCSNDGDEGGDDMVEATRLQGGQLLCAKDTRAGLRTTGILQDKTVNAAEESSMITNTTLASESVRKSKLEQTNSHTRGFGHPQLWHAQRLACRELRWGSWWHGEPWWRRLAPEGCLFSSTCPCWRLGLSEVEDGKSVWYGR